MSIVIGLEYFFRSFFLIGCFVALLVVMRLESQDLKRILESGSKEITVDLRQPVYQNGVLSTEKGGVVIGPNLRIQALKIAYTSQQTAQPAIWKIEAEEELMVEFGDYVFVGDKLEYDFIKKEGLIYQGKTTIEPWHFGGEELELRQDGSYLIRNGYVTTSERKQPTWGIYSNTIHLKEDRNFSAKQVTIRMGKYPILWVPSLRANLDSIFDCPISYRFRWGGRQGPRVGLTYEIFSWECWKTFVSFDYRLTCGPGGGLEINYCSDDNKTTFESINYLANDSSIFNSYKKIRYRFEGTFNKQMYDEKTNLSFTYDKISDRDMPSRYYDRDFDFDTPKRTQLLISRQDSAYITNFYTRFRINSFQTVKQELPTLDINFKPFNIAKTGIINENFISASYLNFVYSKYLPHVHNYASTRLEYQPNFYRSFIVDKFLTITPSVGAVSIIYGNTPEHTFKWLTLFKSSCHLNTQLYCYYDHCKHVVEPYLKYNYYSKPTVSVHKHFVFDVTDGWAPLNYFSFGVKNNVYLQKDGNSSRKIFSSHLYSYAFLNTTTIGQTIPRMYVQFSIFNDPRAEYIVDIGWNLEHYQIDYFNIRSNLTLSDDFAISAEYRHRGRYDWRKVEYTNFFLDAFRTEKRLLHSSLSDRRDTFLVHLFYRFHPNWACEFTSRQGWNRKRQWNYLEYDIDLLTTIQTAWNLRLSFQRQVYDTRVAIYMTVGLKRPEVACD